MSSSTPHREASAESPHFKKFKTPTCVLCRQRKLRCDGGNPCGPCSRSRVLVVCTYVPKPVGVLRTELPKGGACVSCRRRKRRCDGNSPCLTCLTSGHAEECVYAPSKTQSVSSNISRSSPSRGSASDSSQPRSNHSSPNSTDSELPSIPLYMPHTSTDTVPSRWSSAFTSHMSTNYGNLDAGSSVFTQSPEQPLETTDDFIRSLLDGLGSHPAERGAALPNGHRSQSHRAEDIHNNSHLHPSWSDFTAIPTRWNFNSAEADLSRGYQAQNMTPLSVLSSPLPLRQPRETYLPHRSYTNPTHQSSPPANEESPFYRGPYQSENANGFGTQYPWHR